MGRGGRGQVSLSLKMTSFFENLNFKIPLSNYKPLPATLTMASTVRSWLNLAFLTNLIDLVSEVDERDDVVVVVEVRLLLFV